MLVQVLLAHESVAADRQSLVRREYDDGLVRLTEVVESSDQAADVEVQAGDDRVILVEVSAHLRFGPGPRREQLVADDHLAVIEWVHREIVGWQGDRAAIVSVEISLGRNSRIVGCLEG
jgi:hypothetical protein